MAHFRLPLFICYGSRVTRDTYPLLSTGHARYQERLTVTSVDFAFPPGSPQLLPERIDATAAALRYHDLAPLWKQKRRPRRDGVVDCWAVTPIVSTILNLVDHAASVNPFRPRRNSPDARRK